MQRSVQRITGLQGKCYRWLQTKWFLERVVKKNNRKNNLSKCCLLQLRTWSWCLDAHLKLYTVVLLTIKLTFSCIFWPCMHRQSSFPVLWRARLFCQEAARTHTSGNQPSRALMSPMRYRSKNTTFKSMCQICSSYNWSSLMAPPRLEAVSFFLHLVSCFASVCSLSYSSVWLGLVLVLLGSWLLCWHAALFQIWLSWNS